MRSLSLLVLCVGLTGCPGPEGGVAGAPDAAMTAPSPAEAPATRDCFECGDAFVGAGERVKSPYGAPVCSPACKTSLTERAELAREDGDVLCSYCGDTTPMRDATRHESRRFCDLRCQDDWDAEQPLPRCRECQQECDQVYRVTDRIGSPVDMPFCDDVCSDAWVAGMNELQGYDD